MGVQPVWNCPACGSRTLIDHCSSRHCHWHRCKNPACLLVADLARGLGHLVDAAGSRVRWPAVA